MNNDPDPVGGHPEGASMEREWTYIDETGAEYGPYTRAELELYASQGRVSASGQVRNAAGRR